MKRFTNTCSPGMWWLMISALVLIATNVSNAQEVARWRLDGNANDAVGSANGSLVGASFSASAMQGSQSVTLNGTNQYVLIASPSLPTGFSNRTIAAWIRTGTTTGTHYAFSYGATTNQNSMYFGTNGSSVIGGATGGTSLSGGTLSTNVWYHVALTYDGTTARLYLNGTQVASGARSWNLIAGDAIIGRHTANAGYWNGQVDDVRVYSSTLSASTILDLASIPPTPTSPSAAATGSTSVDISWTDASSTETGFEIGRSTTSGSGYTVINTTAANTTTFQDTGLTASTTYYYRIRAIADNANSEYTSEFSIATLAPPPNMPTNLTATVLSAFSIRLDWTDASTDETGFEIQRSATSGSGFTLINTTAANAISFSDTGLTPATTYYYRIRSKKTGNVSSYTAEVSASTPSNLPAPTSLAAVLGSASINLTWVDNATTETNYVIERSETSGTGFTVLSTQPANTVSYSDLSVVAGQPYYYRVKATASSASSGYSNQVTATFLSSATEVCTNLFCDGFGGVGIGTSTIPSGYRFAVKGGMIAEGLKLDLQMVWPDYVFSDDYKLRDLTSLQIYINKNKHLPGIPTEAEVAKDGIDVGEINVKLLEKIEELSLYVIQMEERIRKLEGGNKSLKSQSTVER